jgi:thiol-disulfide isomerase/thioredoxin
VVRRFLAYWLLIVASYCALPVAMAGTDTITVNDTDIDIKINKAPGGTVAIWLPSEAGPQPADDQLAASLAQLGIEMWQVDLLEANFLPVLASSLEKLPVEDVGALVDYAANTTGKKVLWITSGRGAIAVLRGLHAWQLNGGDSSKLAGVIMFSPKLFVETPDPGHRGELMPVVSATNLPLYIIQPDQSPWYWKLQQTIPALEAGGSDVYVRVLHKARDRYFFRPGASAWEKQWASHTPRLILQAIRELESLPVVARRVKPLDEPSPAAEEGKKDHSLSHYTANADPPPLVLTDMNDSKVDLKDYRSKVVLINFWASWCPPCVHEMPSMQRLKQKMQGKPFVILAVNMAEDKATVEKFLSTKVKVEFPVLLDLDGKALRDWKVYAFPTSFVVDKNGLIRYGLFGSIDWDAPQVVDKLTALIN